MKRIGFDAKRAFFNATGLGNYSRTTIEILLKYSSENEYFAYTPTPKRKLFDFPFQMYPNVHLRFPRFNAKIYAALWRTYGIHTTIQADKLTIFHGLSNELPFSITRTNAKKVVTIHDLIFLRYPESYSFWDRKIHYYKAAFACKHADVIVAISKQTATDICHYFPEAKNKVKTIYQSSPKAFRDFVYNSQTAETIHQKYNLPERYILYVGSITLRKNVTTLIQAMKTLPEGIALVIAGNGNLKKEILQAISLFSLTNRVQVFSEVTDLELPYLYKAAFVFVYPSVFEGFGLPIQEALLSGTPVIAGNNSCFEEAGGGGGIYINQQNPNEIAAAVMKIHTDSALSESLVLKGKLHLEQFAEEKIAQEYEEMYEKLCGEIPTSVL